MSPCRGAPRQGLPILVFHGVENQPWRRTNGQTKGSRHCLDAVEAILEQLIETGPTDIASVFARAFELAMQIERERFLRAGCYERTPERRGYANGTKPKRVDTPAGTVTVQVPKTAGHGDTPFYPHSLERGRRSVRAVMLAVAEMYIKGVSTRDVEAVMAEFGIESLSSSQVSRAAKLLDEELAGRAESAHSARSSISSSTRGMKRCAMAGSCAMSPCSRQSASARTSAAGCWVSRWRSRKPRSTGGPFSKASSRAACAGSNISSPTTTAACALLGAPFWAARHGSAANSTWPATPSITPPNAEIRKRIGRQLKSIWTADDLAKAETALAELVASYRDTTPKLADWLEKNVPEGLAVFTLPEHHRKRLRTSNPMERSVQQELKRRTVKVRVFPSEDALLRLVSAVLVEIDEKWATDTKAYIKWECQDA